MELGVYCPRGYVLHEDCRTCALDPLHPCGLTPDVLELMRSENSREPDANSFTPSRLLNICDRQRVLMGQNDYYVNISDAWALIRGNMVHALLERSGKYPGILDVVREVRLTTKLDTRYGERGLTAEMGYPESVTFTGKSDFIGLLREENGTIYAKIVDYKTRKYIPAGFIDPLADTFTAKHVRQLNMYAWLVERSLAETMGWDAHVRVEEIELAYFDMDRTVRFTSAGELTYWGKTYAALPREHPDDVERWIRRAIEQKVRAQTILPAVLEGYPAHWACKKCPVSTICAKVEEQERG